MSEMVERVARALVTLHGGRWDAMIFESEDGELCQHAYLELARAAIAAMREPTDAMKAEGCEELGGFVTQDLWDGFAHSSDVAAAIWRAMIDAGLAEPADADRSH